MHLSGLHSNMGHVTWRTGAFCLDRNCLVIHYESLDQQLLHISFSSSFSFTTNNCPQQIQVWHFNWTWIGLGIRGAVTPEICGMRMENVILQHCRWMRNVIANLNLHKITNENFIVMMHTIYRYLQSWRRPLWGPSPGWNRLLALLLLTFKRHY